MKGLTNSPTAIWLIASITGFSSDFEQLRMNFNSAAAKLAQVLKSVSESSHAIKSSGGEIADASQELSKRTEHQSANLQEAASRLNEVTTTVNATANDVKNASEIAEAHAEQPKRAARSWAWRAPR